MYVHNFASCLVRVVTRIQLGPPGLELRARAAGEKNVFDILTFLDKLYSFIGVKLKKSFCNFTKA